MRINCYYNTNFTFFVSVNRLFRFIYVTPCINNIIYSSRFLQLKINFLRIIHQVQELKLHLAPKISHFLLLGHFPGLSVIPHELKSPLLLTFPPGLGPELQVFDNGVTGHPDKQKAQQQIQLDVGAKVRVVGVSYHRSRRFPQAKVAVGGLLLAGEEDAA